MFVFSQLWLAYSRSWGQSQDCPAGSIAKIHRNVQAAENLEAVHARRPLGKVTFLVLPLALYFSSQGRKVLAQLYPADYLGKVFRELK